MSQIVKRGYMPKDEIEFGEQALITFNKAAKDLYYLLNQGYSMKSASCFVSDHFKLSQRQRLALARIVSTKKQIYNRKEKELSTLNEIEKVNIDGFNTIITLEVALSQSLLIRGMDQAIRDLAGLRGTYRIVDKTKCAIQFLLQMLDDFEVKEAVFYIDRPVSNSGRLKTLIYELAQHYKVQVFMEVINDVDRTLEVLEGVITSDAIILDHCTSWFNLNKRIIEKYISNPWIIEVDVKG